MLAVAGLLVALRVGQNPPCVNGDSYRQCTLAEKPPAPPTTDMLCTAATAEFPCCTISYDTHPFQSYCAADASDVIFTERGLTCSETITTLEQDYSLDCTGYEPPPAEPTTSGEAGDLDGGTIGTIIVASLVGVTLVGGIISVYLLDNA